MNLHGENGYLEKLLILLQEYLTHAQEPLSTNCTSQENTRRKQSGQMRDRVGSLDDITHTPYLEKEWFYMLPQKAVHQKSTL